MLRALVAFLIHARIPFGRIELVAAGEKGVKLQAVKVAHRLRSGAFISTETQPSALRRSKLPRVSR